MKNYTTVLTITIINLTAVTGLFRQTSVNGVVSGEISGEQRKNKKRLFPSLLLLLLHFTFIFGLCGTTFAQSATATLRGTVVDEQSRAVPSVNVVVEDTATAFRRTTVTDSDGVFTIALLPPGTYRLGAELQGFAPFEMREIVLSTNDKLALRIELKVGSKCLQCF